MNPCTLGWYLPLLVKDLPGALQPSDRHPAANPLAIEPGPSIPAGRPRETDMLSSAPPREDKKRPRSDSSSEIAPATAVRGSSPSSLHSLIPPALDSDSSGGGGGGGELTDRRERSQNELVWRELDAKFRRDLPDEAYVGRLAYRGLVMRSCPRIAMLDGIQVERKERDKAERLLRSIFGAGKAKDAGLSSVGIEREAGRS